ncbi:unnamed protein product [Victoria cruziana]
MEHPSDRFGENTRLYNPYQDLQIPVHNLYRLPSSPEFLFQEEAVAQQRSWGENLQYNTGCDYLLGVAVGTAKGLVDGLRATEEGDTLKLHVNRMLNASDQTGQKFGNRLGVVGLLFAGMESAMIAMRDTNDILNSVLVGLGMGALFKAVSGPRCAAVAGTLGGLAAGETVAANAFRI